jgi:hypothetical protein
MLKSLSRMSVLRGLYRTWWENAYGVSRDDVFLVSYPRSGNTWVRFMLLQARPDFSENDFSRIEEIIPDMHGPHTWHRCGRTRVVKSHLKWWQPFRRVIYLVRDGRAATYSNWRYQRDEGKHGMSFEDYIKQPRWPSSWGEHVSGWVNAPETKLIVRYEDLLTEPHKQLKALCGAIGWPMNNERVDQIVRNSSQDRMRAMEQRSGLRLHRVGGSHIASWREVFSDATEEMFRSQLSDDVSKWLG